MGKAALVAAFVACIVIAAQAQTLFQDNFVVTFAPNHVVESADGQTVKVILDQSSGANFKSSKTFVYGGFSSQIQLAGGDSAGTCTAYFLTSDGAAGANHDELDYEFLGNVSGQPYIVQTNVFANGVGGREERIYLWFDPTAGFHTYEVVWNQQQVTFLVDNIPIRIFGNYESLGVDYPSQPMSVYASFFDASQWATRGGQDPIDYTQGPFAAYYRDFGLDGCTGPNLATCTTDPTSWWSQPSYKLLSTNEIAQLRWIRQNYLTYSYCTDTKRNPVAPIECAQNNP